MRSRFPNRCKKRTGGTKEKPSGEPGVLQLNQPKPIMKYFLFVLSGGFEPSYFLFQGVLADWNYKSILMNIIYDSRIANFI